MEELKNLIASLSAKERIDLMRNISSCVSGFDGYEIYENDEYFFETFFSR